MKVSEEQNYLEALKDKDLEIKEKVSIIEDLKSQLKQFTQGRLIARTCYAPLSNENALLISKAPEMLEMLQWFVYNFEGVFHEGTETDNKVNEAKELIKQATEI